MGSKSGRKRRQRERAQQASKKKSQESKSAPKSSAHSGASRGAGSGSGAELSRTPAAGAHAERKPQDLGPASASSASPSTNAPNGRTELVTEEIAASPNAKSAVPQPGPVWPKPETLSAEAVPAPVLAQAPVSEAAPPSATTQPAASGSGRRQKLALFVLAVLAPVLIAFLVMARSF